MPPPFATSGSVALKVFTLFALLAYAAGIAGSKAAPTGPITDIAKFGAPVAGMALALWIAKALGWLVVQATAWQYTLAGLLAAVAVPLSFVLYFALSTATVLALGMAMPDMKNDHPLYVSGAYLTALASSAIFPLCIGYALRMLTGVWDWTLAAAIFALLWLSLLTPSPWDRPFVCAVAGVIGVWLCHGR